MATLRRTIYELRERERVPGATWRLGWQDGGRCCRPLRLRKWLVLLHCGKGGIGGKPAWRHWDKTQ